MSKIFVITGASYGLGSGLTLELSRLGHRVFSCARTESADAARTSTWTHRCVDVTDAEAVKEWIDSVVQESGRIDVLVNNAAVMNPPGPVWTISAEDFDSVIDINIKGVANLLRFAVPVLLEQKSGIVINMISGSAKRNLADSGAYNASKAAVESLTATLAKELPTSVIAVSLIPGPTKTKMLRKILGSQAEEFPDLGEWVQRAVPLILGIDGSLRGRTISVPGRESV